MGIFRLKKLSILIPLLGFSVLAACEPITKKYLTVDTVKNTLDIVDNTLVYLEVDGTDRDTNFGTGYNEIFEQFTGQDYSGTSPKDFNYNDEPYLQFRYMKSILENKSSDFTFGTKYYDEQPKSLYFDFSTGQKDTTLNANNRVICSCLLGGDIKVNSFNQIFINMAFQNTYTLTNGVSFPTNRYVNFLIDYDFNATGINYILKAYTRNDERQAPYIGYITYQYDYIRVIDGRLTEYRKFTMESSTELAPDETHLSFDDYVSQGIAYRVDQVKWYADGVYYVSKYMTESKQKLIGNALFDLGMFEPFSYVDFLSDYENRTSITTSSIYSMISNKYGDDIQYAFLTKNPSAVEHINEANNPYYNPESVYPNTIYGIDVCDEDGNAIPRHMVGSSTKIGDLFQGFTDLATSSVGYVPVWYISRIEPIEQISPSNIVNTSKFTLYFEADKATSGVYNKFSVSPTITVKQAYEQLGNKYDILSSDVTGTFNIVIVERSSGYSCIAQFKFGDSLSFLNKAMEFPQTLIDYGVPKYTGTDVVRYKMEDTSRYENGYGCFICGYSIFDLDSYFLILTSNGFTRYTISYDSYGYPTVLYSKQVDSKNSLFIKLSYGGISGSYETYWLRTYRVKCSDLSNISYSFPSYLISAGVPEYQSDNAYFDDQSSNGDGLYIYKSNHREVMAYSIKLRNYGFDMIKQNSIDGYMVFKTIYNGGRYFIYAEIDYYEDENCDYYAIFWLEENPDYFNINNMYLTSYFDTWNSTYASNSVKLVPDGSVGFTLSNSVICLAGKEFKFIANEDWSVSNPSTSYNGFGYDDVYNISSYLQFFSRGANGKIVVLQNVSLMVHVYTYTDHLEIFFTAEAANIF